MKSFPPGTRLNEILGIDHPIVCGAMYPCSNAELIAAVSEAGGIGVIQPLSLVYVYGTPFEEGLRRIRALTSKPIGMNVIVEKGSRTHENRMRGWVETALENGIRFFTTALGNPSWVVRAVEPHGGIVFHNTTERKWALRALEHGVHGLNCTNNRAGGHAGPRTAAELYEDLKDLGVPLVCAGGVGDENEYAKALQLGYAGVQLGTRFIATTECASHFSYKNAIIRAREDDIVLTNRVTGIPLAVIRTPYLEKTGTEAGPIARYFLRNPRTKRATRLFYALQSGWRLKRSSTRGLSSKDFWQAGKSVAGIHSIEPAGEIVRRFARAAVEA